MKADNPGMQFFAYNAKVADITHADTNKHTVSLATMGLPLNTVAMVILVNRVAGTGNIRVYSNEGTTSADLVNSGGRNWITIGLANQRLQYDLTVANDDWDLFCLGYWTE